MVGCAEFAKKLSSTIRKSTRQTAVERVLEKSKTATSDSLFHDPWQSTTFNETPSTSRDKQLDNTDT